MIFIPNLDRFGHIKNFGAYPCGNQTLWVKNDHNQIQSCLPEHMKELNNQASEKQLVASSLSQASMTRDLNANSSITYLILDVLNVTVFIFVCSTGRWIWAIYSLWVFGVFFINTEYWPTFSVSVKKHSPEGLHLAQLEWNIHIWANWLEPRGEIR